VSGEPAFVGRAGELGELERVLAAACEGRGGCVLVAGEPGIGKTSLCSQFAERARRRGVRVLWGRAWEWGGAPPFWPWLQVLRALTPDSPADTLLDPSEGAKASSTSLLPTGLVPGGPLGANNGTGQRFALFDALAERLRRAAAAEPLVVVLEDLHAADVPTLLLLRFAVEQLVDAPLLVLGTWRTVETSPGAEALAILSDLSRRVRTLDLSGLDAAEVEQLIRVARGVECGASAAALRDRTGGNPLLVASLLQSESAGENTGALPLRARAAVERRLERLEPNARAVVSAAAVIGREMAVLLLAQVCELPLDRVLEAVQTLRAERIFVEKPENPGRYGFFHGLFREVVYASLSAVERLKLHRAAGSALEALYGAEREAHLPELARHFLAVSPDPDRGFDYAVAAGMRALRALAYEDAARYFRQALDARPAPSSACQTLGAVWLRLGDAQALYGANSDAKDSYRRAHQLALDARDPVLEAEVVVAFARAIGFGRRDEEAVRWLTRALDHPHPTPTRVRLLCALLDRVWMHADSQPRLLAWTNEALELARQSNDPRVLAEALAATLLFMWYAEAASFHEYRARSRELLQLAQSIGDPNLKVEAQRWRFNAAMIEGAIDEAREALDAYERLAEQLGRAQLGFNAVLRRSMLACLEGRFDDALALLPIAERLARRAGDPQALFLGGALSLQLGRERGDRATLEAALDQLEAIIGNDLPQVISVAVRAAFEGEVGRLEAAARSLDRYFELTAGFPASGGPVAFINASWAIFHLGDAQRARAFLPLLERYAGLFMMGGALNFLGPTSLHLGLLHATEGHLEAARTHLQRAIADLDRIGARPLAARARGVLEQVEARALQSRPPAAAAPASPSNPPPASVSAVAQGLFALEGDSYCIGLDGQLARVRASKGLGLIEVLLRQEGTEVHVLELAGSALDERGPSAPLLDGRAKAEYRARLRSLQADLDEAEGFGDLGRAERARAELDALTSALSQATGLGGRDRASGAAERARARVTLAIRRSIKGLETVHPAAAAHFAAAISTGTFCVYRPDPRARVVWQFSPGVPS
jgi:tetratricopeptide (TPR) repeat protein